MAPGGSGEEGKSRARNLLSSKKSENCSYKFCLLFIGERLVTWPHVAAREAEKYNLATCLGRRDGKLLVGC